VSQGAAQEGKPQTERVAADIDKGIHDAMRAYIRENGTTIKFIVERGIREFLDARSA